MSDLIKIITHKNTKYSVLKLNVVEDNALSWKAKGLHTYLISRPPLWTIKYADLLNRSSDCGTSLKSCIKELKSAGYLKINQEKDGKGRFKGSVWEVFEEPSKSLDNSASSPQVHFPHTDFPHAENVQGTSNHNTSNHINKSSSSLPPPPKADSIPTEEKEAEEEVEKEEKTLVIPPLPKPFDNLKDFELIEAESICKKKGLNMQEQAIALSIFYKDKTINNPSNLLLKTLRGRGVAGAEGIIKAEEEKKTKEAERQKKAQEQKAERIEKEKEDKEYYAKAENRLNVLSDDERKKIEELAKESLPAVLKNMPVLVRSKMCEIVMSSGP